MPASTPVRKGPNPFLFIGLVLASAGTFYFIVKHREAAHPASKQPLQHAHPLIPPRQHDRHDKRPRPTFDSNKVIVIYVLGGPGAGKGTQCGRLVEDFNFSHLSAGDLLREEQNREGSQYGELIRTYIREGNIVPQEVTIKLLETAMSAALQTRSGPGWTDGKGRFLIDGFPRKMDQALTFEQTVCSPSQVLVFEADEKVMIQRILERGKTSGREDDNIESLKKRLETHKQLVEPVITYLEGQGKVVKINSNQSIEQCHKGASEAVLKVLV